MLAVQNLLLAAENPSKEDELLHLQGPPLGEFCLSGPPTFMPLKVLQRTLRGLDKQRSSLLPSHHPVEHLQQEAEPPLNGMFWGVNPAREGGSERASVKQVPRR